MLRTTAGAGDELTPARETCPIPRSLRRRAPLPESSSRLDGHGDLPKRPRRSQQPDVHVFFFVATPEIGTPECTWLVKPARALEAATRFDERPDVANNPDANRSEVFFLWLSNGPVHQRRRASTQAAANRATDRAFEARRSPKCNRR